MVHLGCGDGKLTAALCAGDAYLVQGLDGDARNVEKARQHAEKLGLAGRASFRQWDGRHLPYVDNLVNLIVADDLGKLPKEEALRALAPGGVLCLRQGDTWRYTTKPRPKEIDEWTHFLHGPDGNPVSTDARVGPPRHMQWVGGPRWARSHEHLASVSAAASAGGRIFYIVDEGPIASVTLPPKWFLVGRDAFNGVVLWKRPIPAWAPHLRAFRNGPPQLPRRLIAVGDRVYVTLALDAPLSAVDAASGEILRTYAETKKTEEVICSEGILLVAINREGSAKADAGAAERRGKPRRPRKRDVAAVEPAEGKLLWKKPVQDLLPLTLAADAEGVFFKDGETIVCLALKTGRELWRSEAIARPDIVRGWYAPTLVVQRDVVLLADGKTLTALARDSGRRLWTDTSNLGFNSPPDVFVARNLVWTGKLAFARDPGFTAARDLRTGKAHKQFETDKVFLKVGMPHHRCYRNKATERYILCGKAGIEFFDLETGRIRMHHWVRGTCQYGVLPCNGLVYAPPHACACYIKAKLNSFNALAADRQPAGKEVAAPPLEKGPAYEAVSGRKAPAKAASADDWPTYRHDAARRGATKSAVPAELKRAWQVDLGGRLSSPVIAGGKVFIAQIDAHTVHALDAGDGKRLWRYTADGRVDSPPTVHDGLVLFGCADGRVYCLRASDGAMVWRFRAAPEDRHLVSYGQMESVWPVHGSVLVEPSAGEDGGAVVWFAAGRSSYLDGGLYIYRLDARTGRQLSRTQLYSPDPKTGRQPPARGFEMAGALPDVLSADAQGVYMRHVKFDRRGVRRQDVGPHLFSPTGFLDGSWWHRSYWLYGARFHAGWAGWWQVGNRVPSGRILALDDATVYGFGRDVYPRSSPLWSKGEKYHLFAAPIDQPKKTAAAAKPKTPKKGAAKKPATKKAPRKRQPIRSTVRYRWSRQVPLLVRAMVLADKTLFVAGPVGDGNHSLAAFGGREGIVLQAVSAADGAKQAEQKLESIPAFDGMAAAGGRLYVALESGKLLCLGGP